MARMPKFEPLYEAFEEFLDRCVLDDRSLLWPTEHAWTRDVVADLVRRMITEMQMPGAEMSFEEKLQVQMEGASATHWMVLADVYYVYFLPSSFITQAKRLADIRWAAQQAGITPPPETAKVWEAHREGFTRTSFRYHQKYLQFWLILLFADHVKAQADPEAVVRDPEAMQQALDKLLDHIPSKTNRAYDMRHAMLYLAFPDQYERIISTRDKDNIIETFGDRLTGSLPEDRDAAIHQIRETLSPQYQVPDRPFDFYDPQLRPQWREPTSPPDEEEPPPEPEALPEEVPAILAVLERTRNVILYGPPGTGKTFLAQKAALTWAGADQRVEWVTFHQSYGYEDFVEGLRPVTSDKHPGGLIYDVPPGVLRRMCSRAADDPAHRYVLVIDEINRGNIAKILGELITLLEDDKRAGEANALTVTLPASGDKFSVPGNVWLVGTMNTADRSIALLDVALRRRFAFVELMPRSGLLADAHVESEESDVPLAALLRGLNRGIRATLDRDHQIGHSYLLEVARAPEEERAERLAFAWNHRILPLLEEYYYGQPDKLAQVLAPFRTDMDVETEFDGEEGFAVEWARLDGDDLLAALVRLAEWEPTR